jgi:SAM-dependent methyltransferase
MDQAPDDACPGGRGAAGELGLWVAEAGSGKPPGPTPGVTRIEITFTDDGNRPAVLAGDGVTRYRAGSEWRPVRARYAPFALASDFVGRLLAERPAAVIFDELSGLTLELARLADALGFAVTLRDPAPDRIDADDAIAQRWLRGLQSQVHERLPARDDGQALDRHLSGPDAVGDAAGAPPVMSAPGYEAYALGRRDHALLSEMQQGFARRFDGCARVLDVGCGTGVFLDILARRGIGAVGVERNAVSARYARSLGLGVLGEDALSYLGDTSDRFDGVYCSHFVEHLPVDAAERLVAGIARVLDPGGIAVFVFPDPESIRSQLLGFWRDPEHVRFYHPELVELFASAAGLELVDSSLDTPGRRVVPFTLQPPLPEPDADGHNTRLGPWQRALQWLGIAHTAELAAERARGDALELAVRRLWDVNQTWAWDDNAVLCFRKRGGNSPGTDA